MIKKVSFFNTKTENWFAAPTPNFCIFFITNKVANTTKWQDVLSKEFIYSLHMEKLHQQLFQAY